MCAHECSVLKDRRRQIPGAGATSSSQTPHGGLTSVLESDSEPVDGSMHSSFRVVSPAQEKPFKLGLVVHNCNPRS